MEEATPQAVLAAYQGVRSRTLGLLRPLSDEQALLTVPACPAWTIHDLVCHLYGVIEDILEGRLEGAGSDPWTAAQIARHAPLSLTELCDAWEQSAERFDDVLVHIPSPVNLRIVMDQATHEHDLRHTLGQFGAQDSDAIAMGTIWLLGSVGQDLTEQFTSVDASRFETFRALSGRRSRRQLAALGFPAEAFAERLAGSPISVPEGDLVEPQAN